MGLFAKTIINGMKYLGCKVSNTIDSAKELTKTYDLEPIPEDSPILNIHENVLIVELIKDSFMNEDLEIINIYLDSDLSLKPSSDRRQALWRNLVKSTAWQKVHPNDLTKYLHVSVKNEAYRIKRDREKSDRLWGNFKVCYQNDLVSDIYDNHRILTPETVILRNEDIQIRRDIIRNFMNECSPREKEIIILYFSGFTLTEAARAVGAKKYHYQAIQRKLKTRLKKFKKNVYYRNF
jgi:DNA-directed RNA polymerase specialized sigma24 family protein